MKHPIYPIALLVSAVVVASIANAQNRRTVAETRAEHNAKVCKAAKQAKGCNQAQVPEGGTIYATDAAFIDGELIPEILAKRAEERTSRAVEALYRWFLTASPADRVQACFRLPDPEICR